MDTVYPRAKPFGKGSSGELTLVHEYITPRVNTVVSGGDGRRLRPSLETARVNVLV